MSILLVIRKAIDIRNEKIRDRLFKEYSSILAEILLQEIPQANANKSATERYRYYESAIIKLKSRLGRMTNRGRRFHKEAIRMVLIDYSKELKGELTDRIIYYIYSFKILDDLMDNIESRHWWIRASAANDFGLLRAKRAIVPLTAALEDPHPDVRFLAMQSLLMIVGVPALYNILRISKSFSQWTAVELSVIINEYRNEVAPYLIEALSFASPSVMLFSIALLGKIGFVDAVEPLIQLCRNNPDPILFSAAIEALGQLGDERALSQIIKASQNNNTAIRLKALEAMGRLGAKKCISIISERINTGDIHEKRIAAKALGNLGKEGTDALSKMMISSDEYSQLIAIEVVEEIERDRS
jgi:HEAT repeat protein